MRFDERSRARCVALVSALALGAAGVHADPVQRQQPQVRTDDVDRFFRLYDATAGHPSTAQLQADYLDAGSTGLHQFLESRIDSVDKLAAAMMQHPEVYAGAQDCAKALPQVRHRLVSVFARLAQIYPTASFPPVTVVIGRDNTGGTTTADGVIIGLETVCRATWMDPDMTSRLVHLIAHEYVHVQQPAAQVDSPPGASLLFQSLLEGGAEFIGELTSGAVSNVHLQKWTRGQECAIERRFASDAMGSDMSAWLYTGPGTPEKPGDLGYWVGYRVAKSYYAKARDKRRAVAQIIAITNDSAAAFLNASGWRPDTDCHAH